MFLFNRKKKEREYRSQSLSLHDQELARLLGIDTDGVSANKMKEATYYTCMRILTDSVGKLPLKIYKESASGNVKAPEHYLYQLLKLRPNRFMSSSDFWKAVEFQRLNSGHAIVLINTLPNGKVEGLYPLDTKKVSIYFDRDGIVGMAGNIWYVYTDGDKEYKFKHDSVLHFKGMTADGIQGMAVKDYLSSTIENMQYGTDYVNGFFKGGLSAKGILQFDSNAVDENGLNRMKARFEKMATGMNQVGKIATVPLGFSFSTINTSMADAQFLELNNLSIRQIAAAFGIKQHQLNILDGAKFNNVQQQNDEFYRDTLMPILDMYEKELTWKLFREDELQAGYFFKFNVDAILRASQKERYEAYQVGINTGIITPNEAREREDLPPQEGADRLMVQGAMKPLDKLELGYESAAIPTDSTLKGGE